MSKQKISLYNEKYEVILNDGNDGNPYVFKALRYGEEWQDLVGNNLVLAMFQKIQDLQEALKEYQILPDMDNETACDKLIELIYEHKELLD